MAQQREIDKRTGLKTKTRPFMLPVSESAFSGDRIRFRDTGSVFLDYSIDKQFHYYNTLMDADWIYCHNKSDVNYYKGFIKSPSN